MLNKCVTAPGRGLTRGNDQVDKCLTEAEGGVALVNGPINLYPFVGIGFTPVKRRIEPRGVTRIDEPSFSREAVIRENLKRNQLQKETQPLWTH